MPFVKPENALKRAEGKTYLRLAVYFVCRLKNISFLA